MKPLIFGLALAAGLSGATAAQDCPDKISATTPKGQFTLEGGLATDKRTRLQWQRCPQGQTWISDTCSGTVRLFNWQAALLAESPSDDGKGAWRVPNVKELRSIVEISCYGPAQNLHIFPTTGSGVTFWSSSPSAQDNAKAWVVSFALGAARENDRDVSNALRLVRSQPIQ